MACRALLKAGVHRQCWVREALRQATKRSRNSLYLVLVVDDDQAVTDFVDRVLREAGYRTLTAGRGPEAIELASKEPFDLLLTDVKMPQMTGDELARRLRQDEPSLKVLYLTGYSDQLFREKTTLWQDEAFLEKPCTIEGLLQAVSRSRSAQRRADLTAPRMHLEMRILPQRVRSARTRGARRARAGSSAPRSSRPASRPRSAPSARRASRRARSARAQIDAARRIQAQVPHAVGGQPAAVAAAAEGLGRRRDDAEHRAVRQPKAIGGRRRVVSTIGSIAPVARGERVEHLAPRDDASRRPARGAADVHVLDEAHLGVHRPAVLDQIHQLVVVDAADDDACRS